MRPLVTWMLLISLTVAHPQRARLPATRQRERTINDLRSATEKNLEKICSRHPVCQVERPDTECPEVKLPDKVECPVCQSHSSSQSNKNDNVFSNNSTVTPSKITLQSNQTYKPNQQTNPINPQNTQVAFTAELRSDKAVTDDVPYTFDDVLFGTTDDFIPMLGVFTCPDNDFYIFYWTLMASEGRISGMLVKDGQDVKPGPLTREMPSGSHSGSSSMSTILQCTVGSHVWVKAVAWPDAKACNHVNKEYSSFTWFKIFSEDNPNAVGFTAQLSSNKSLNGTWIFDEEIIDIGEDYDPVTGVFTCPQDGVYVFFITIHCACGATAQYLRKNGVAVYRLTALYPVGTPDSGTTSVTRLLDCQAGDMITLYRNGNIDLYGQTSSFTGFRLNDPDPIAFHAGLSSDTDILDGYAIPFDDVAINHGNYFFPGISAFVCPDNNTYLFTWAVTIISESSKRAGEARLMMADSVKKTGPITSEVLSGPASSTSSTQCIVQCVQNQALQIEAIVSDSNPMGFLSVGWTNFVGFRLPQN